MLIAAAVLIILIALAHSYLGEKYIIMRLLRYKHLPKLFGDDSFTRTTLRFAWHLTTVAWFGFAYLLIAVTAQAEPGQSLLITTSWVFASSALLSLIFTRGRHLSWIVFSAIALLSRLALA
ncbi:MAG: hypothetical protein KC422_07855 [Trueperaceae bacterium]|nr:hypothetical protein [Trueperaceae bacterium]